MRRNGIVLGLTTLCLVALCDSRVQAEACWKTPPPTWFDTRDCPSRAKVQMLSTGEFGENGSVVCKNVFMFCGHTLTRSKTLANNSGRGGHCPGSNDFDHPDICCAALDQAVKTKQPCDPQVDMNCDGSPNTDDGDPLAPMVRVQDYIWVDSPSGEAFGIDFDNKKVPLAHCTRLKTGVGYGQRERYL